MSIRKNPINFNKQKTVVSLHPIVQRLVDKFAWFKDYVIYVPEVLVGSLEYDYSVLKANEELVTSGKHKGNTKEFKSYKQFVPCQLTSVQIEWGVGLLLSDVTLQLNNNGTNCRLKMQQVDYHYPFLAVTRALLAPWFLGPIPPAKKNKSGSNMQEIQSIQNEAFMYFAHLFQDPCIPLIGNACIQKQISNELEKHFTPLCIAAWFIGDGGRQDYAKTSGGKGIQFHTQGF